MAVSDLDQKKLHIKSVNWQTLTWLDIEQPTRHEIEYLKQNYNFHDLELDDCLRRVHRPTIDAHEKYLFMMFHFPVFHKRTQGILPSQMSVFLGKDYLITLYEGNLEPLVEMFKNCELNQGARMEFMGRSSAHSGDKGTDHYLNHNATLNFGRQHLWHAFRTSPSVTEPRFFPHHHGDHAHHHHLYARPISAQALALKKISQCFWSLAFLS